MESFLKRIEEMYKIVQDSVNLWNKNYYQLDAMLQLFKRIKLAYFITIKEHKFPGHQTVEGDITHFPMELDTDNYEIIIVASTDEEFKNSLHKLQAHHLLSDYSVLKTIETKMDTIIYRSFKDIIRLTAQYPSSKSSQYSQFLQSIQAHNPDAHFFAAKREDKSNDGNITEEEEEEKKEEGTKSEFKQSTQSPQQAQNFSQLISLSEVSSIVYKNICLEGIYPFNIFLNTSKRNKVFDWVLELASRLLSNKSYKLNHHLSMQFGNVFYSFDDSGLFRTWEMQEKEKFTGKFNEFTKVRVFDFFPLDQSVKEIASYIHSRLDTFDAQLKFYILPDPVLKEQINTKIKRLKSDLKDCIETIKSQKALFPCDNTFYVQDQDLDNTQRSKTYSPTDPDLMKLCIDNLLAGIKALDQLENLPISKLFKENYDDFIDTIQQEINKITHPNEQTIITKFDILIFISYFESTGKYQIFKQFLKLILTNRAVPEHPCVSITQNDLYQPRGNGEPYTLMLRKLGYQFLSHYFQEFKYFYSWPIIIAETELTKYKLLENNCQTPGILFSYQIKELFKQFIEPLFISGHDEFLERFRKYFQGMNKDIVLPYEFALSKSKQPGRQTSLIDFKGGDKQQQKDLEKTIYKVLNISEQKGKVGQSNSVSRTTSQTNLNRYSMKIPEHNQYRDYYLIKLTDNFMVFGSKTNEILNKTLFPLTLDKPIPYHQFFGEAMGCEYMNALINGDALILQLYKVIISEFPDSKANLDKIVAVSKNILGNDFLDKTKQFKMIVQLAYKHTYKHSIRGSIAASTYNNKLQGSPQLTSQSTPLPLDFMSTLFAIYDSLYFMRNKFYKYSDKQNANNSGAVSGRPYDVEEHRNDRVSSSFQQHTTALVESMKQSKQGNQSQAQQQQQSQIQRKSIDLNSNSNSQSQSTARNNNNASINNHNNNGQQPSNNNNNSNIYIDNPSSLSRSIRGSQLRNSSSASISHSRSFSMEGMRIFDMEKKKYFRSQIRHEQKDICKELAFYYYNSIRIKHGTFTRKDKLSYIGFLLIRDPTATYALP